jgi:hypothetical protein
VSLRVVATSRPEPRGGRGPQVERAQRPGFSTAGPPATGISTNPAPSRPSSALTSSIHEHVSGVGVCLLEIRGSGHRTLVQP